VQFRRDSLQAKFYKPLELLLSLKSYSLHKRVDLTLDMTERGLYWPTHGLTMIGQKRLDNVETCLSCVLEENIQGDVIERVFGAGARTSS